MEFNLKKGVQVINFLADQEQKQTGNAIDKLKLLKLIWIADKLHLRKYGSPILGDSYFAMKLGPVASGIKNICDKNTVYLGDKAVEYIEKYLKITDNKIKPKKELDKSCFSDSDLEVLNEVFQAFGSQKSSKLINFTHKYPEWNKFERKLNSGEITQASMNYLDFFENTPAQDKIFDIDEEHLNLSKSIFKENYDFYRLFA